MTLSNVQAQWQLNGVASSTANQGSGTVNIGHSSIARKTWTDANIIYAFTVKSTSASDVATLTFSSGAIATTAGNPDITRWGAQVADESGLDFEGITLPTMDKIIAVFLETPAANTGTVTVVGPAALGDGAYTKAMFQICGYQSDYPTASAETMAFTLPTTADAILCTVVGKTA